MLITNKKTFIKIQNFIDLNLVTFYTVYFDHIKEK